MKKSVLFILFCIATHVVPAQVYQWKNISVDINSSFRALSVVDNHVAWVGGSKGWIGRTSDGGQTWSFKQVNNFETLDFRSVYAFDSLTAVIANAGSPAFIFRTTDGGKNWSQVYKNENKAAFIDGEREKHDQDAFESPGNRDHSSAHFQGKHERKQEYGRKEHELLRVQDSPFHPPFGSA